MLTPLLFTDVFKDYIWGGRNLARFGKKLPEGTVAESWELSAHPDGLSRVVDGPWKGRSIVELMRKLGDRLVGTEVPEWARREFPLLVKYIDAEDRLSVQVHPDDLYAGGHEHGSLGKNEMWYVLEAQPGARLIADVLPGTTRAGFERAIAGGTALECLKSIEARAGDVFYIPAGMVHAIGAGIVLLEVQQSSNATYRVYDYDRVDASGRPRDLHLDKALEVIDFAGGVSVPPAHFEMEMGAASRRRVLVASPFFITEHLKVFGTVDALADGSRFYSYTVLRGSLELAAGEFRRSLRAGQTVLIPAALGEYRLSGTFEALLAYLPDGALLQAGKGQALGEAFMKAVLSRNPAGIRAV